MGSGRLHIGPPGPRQARSFQIKKYKYFQHERLAERLGEAAVQSLSSLVARSPPRVSEGPGARGPAAGPGRPWAPREPHAQRTQRQTTHRERLPSKSRSSGGK